MHIYIHVTYTSVQLISCHVSCTVQLQSYCIKDNDVYVPVNLRIYNMIGLQCIFKKKNQILNGLTVIHLNINNNSLI